MKNAQKEIFTFNNAWGLGATVPLKEILLDIYVSYLCSGIDGKHFFCIFFLFLCLKPGGYKEMSSIFADQ
jgi:hypothetical protein